MATSTSDGSFKEEYCRCCLTDATDLLFDVFSVLEESKGPITELIATMCGIIITETDATSKSICGDCLRDLVGTFRFRERCHRANRILGEKRQEEQEEPVAIKRDSESDKEAVKNVKQNIVPKEDKESQTELMIEIGDKSKECFRLQTRLHRRPFQCNVCLKRFKQSVDLLLHRGAHQYRACCGRFTMRLNHRRR